VFIDVKVPAAETRMVGRLERAGFELVDTSVTLTLADASDTRLSRRPEVVIRQSTPADESSVLPIAAEMRNSRFHLDPLIDGDVASRIKVAWVANFFRGTRGDRLLLVDIDGNVSGFLLAIENSDALIDLIAVRSDQRRHGLAREMVLELIGVPPRAGTISVGTQVSNIASLRFYESLGFRTSGASYVLHCHGRSA
jgi:ribosomal protein S18 acetylase RimI-like enzyme